MSTSPYKKLHDLLEDFGVAMLVTRTTDGNMRGRPMALAEAEPDGTLWFATDRGSDKLNEIERDGHVVVTMQSSTKFISLSGRATPVDDRASMPCLRHHGYASASQTVSMPAASIARAEASISSSGSIVSCMTPTLKGTALTRASRRP